MTINPTDDGPPIGRGPKAIHDWVQAQISSGKPRGPLYVKLFEAPIPDDMAELDARKAVRDSLGDVLVNRNIDGIKAEKLGRESRAIALYEANVADRFDGGHPYERLRIIYAAQGRYRDAIRVCEAYLQYVSQDPKVCESYRRWLDKYRQKGKPSPAESTGA
jgi:hypothetical protein